jgi:glycosyltransferase involved in cell wall biosynthesis
MAEKLPDDIHLLILGSGIEESKVKEISERKSNIHFLGYQSKEKSLGIIRSSDLLIQPSRMEGGLSYTLLESMACGTPIICTDAGGAKDTLSHMKNSYIIKSHNSSELLSAIIRIMDNSEIREKLRLNALKEIKNHDWSVIGPKYLEIYRKLIDV